MVVVTVADKEVAATLVTKWMSKWDIAVCMDLLYMCKAHLASSSSPSALCKQMEQLYAKMEVFEELLKVDTRWKTWQAISDACDDNAGIMVRRLLELNQHTLARKVIHYSVLILASWHSSSTPHRLFQKSINRTCIICLEAKVCGYP